MIFLKPNDHVALACPGSICLSQDHPQITQRYLKEYYQLHSNFKHDTVQPLSAAERAGIFLEHILNDHNRCIIALRGGEGSADIIPYLEQHRQAIEKAKPKILLGFSDITALLVYFSQEFGWPAIHGSSPLQFALNNVSRESETATMDYLLGVTNKIKITPLMALNSAAHEKKNIKAELTGGCLSLIDISIKDIWEVKTENKILFLEDVGEKAHKIIRTLKYLDRIGLFIGVQAVILGDFTAHDIGEDEVTQLANREAIMRALVHFASQQSYPVLHTSQFGHGKINMPLLYNDPYQLQLGKSPYLTNL